MRGNTKVVSLLCRVKCYILMQENIESFEQR